MTRPLFQTTNSVACQTAFLTGLRRAATSRYNVAKQILCDPTYGATNMVCRGIRPSLYYGAAQLPPTTSPTCRRLAPDFALFPYGLSGAVHLAGVLYQTARSRALSGSNRTGPTRWGTGFRKSHDGSANAPASRRRAEDDGFACSAKKALPLLRRSPARVAP